MSCVARVVTEAKTGQGFTKVGQWLTKCQQVVWRDAVKRGGGGESGGRQIWRGGKRVWRVVRRGDFVRGGRNSSIAIELVTFIYANLL